VVRGMKVMCCKVTVGAMPVVCEAACICGRSSPPPSPAPTTSTHKTQNDRAHLDGCEDGMALVCFRVAVTGCKMTVYWFLR
jgi:hypothetical protein